MIKKIDPSLNVHSLTFERFWSRYHEITRISPKNKSISRHVWDKTISMERKRKAYKDIKPNSGAVYQYLKTKLCNYEKKTT